MGPYWSDAAQELAHSILETGQVLKSITIWGDPRRYPALNMITAGGIVEVRYEIPKQPKQLRSCECCKCTCCHGDNPERGRAGNPVSYDDCWDKSG